VRVRITVTQNHAIYIIIITRLDTVPIPNILFTFNMPKDPRFTQLLDFPVYCLQFTKDHQLLIGGGGGTSKSGVKNKLASKSQCRYYTHLLTDAHIGTL
jgi:hypothetical protein